MPSPQRASLPVRSLGHGIGLRREHFSHLLEHDPGSVEWFEIISENFFEPGGRPWEVLRRVRSARPVVMHGVALSIGSVDPLDEKYLQQLEALMERLEPAWVSDHLCWGAWHGKNSHDLLPLPLTEECLAHVVGRVERLQDRLRRTILLENVSSYLAFQASCIPEQEFLMELARRSGCQLLLDVNNVYVSARNHGFSAEAYLDAIDPAFVAQIHLAGHTDEGWYLHDTHVGPVPDPVWSLYERAVKRFGRVPSLIEWDTDIPPYEVVVAERDRAALLEASILAEGQP